MFDYKFSTICLPRLNNSDHRFFSLDFQQIIARTNWDSTHYLFGPSQKLSSKIDQLEHLFHVEKISSEATELDHMRDPKYSRIRRGILFFIENGDDTFKLAAEQLNVAFSMEENIVDLTIREESERIAEMRQAWSSEAMQNNLSVIGLSKTYNEMCEIEDRLLANAQAVIDAGNLVSTNKHKVREELNEMFHCFMGMVYGAANMKDDELAQLLISQCNVVIEKYDTKHKIRMSKMEKDQD